uniref:Uncharacterized protein n=1 Tax=Anguilla anguilla TaxID=7936 RepID=A0A0E9WR81_ANGAN
MSTAHKGRLDYKIPYGFSNVEPWSILFPFIWLRLPRPANGKHFRAVVTSLAPGDQWSYRFSLQP